MSEPYPNYSALTTGMKVYTDAVRELINARLAKAMGNTWWQDGVLAAVTRHQRDNLARDSQKEPDRKKIDLLDPHHFPHVIQRNWDGVFRADFPNQQKTLGLLNTISAVRGGMTAHPVSGDLPADDVAHSLYDLWQVLTMPKLPEAETVEGLRRRVLGIGADAGHTRQATPTTPRTRPVTSPAKAGELPYWWQVAEPHEAFKNPATIDESLFAATLGAVHAGSARREYLDPSVFLTATYFTENLKQTIRDVASRLHGGEGPAVTEMQTPFGGGKTHALLALYHLIKHPEAALAVPGVKEALGDVVIPKSAKVLVFDGYEHGTEASIKETGAEVYTLWGELSYQADPRQFHTLISESDFNGNAPGNARFRQVLQQSGPTLILIDELVSYLVKLRFSNQRRSLNRYRQTIQFLQELMQEAGNIPGLAILISLPKSKREFGGLDPLELRQELGILEELRARADRVVSKRMPVNDEEIYTLMARRLFKRVDPDAAERAVDAFRKIYAKDQELYDGAVLTDDYHQQQIAAYPLHPELIDVLYKKWSTASDFPRTRSVLQLLASVVADQWRNQLPTYAIQSAHVNLERERIRTRIVSAAGAGMGYDSVVAADIIGGDAHADMLDEKRGGDYERHHIARGMATTVLMHSFGGQSRVGALPTEVRIGTVAPNLGPEYVAEILGALEENLWYVHREGALLRFQTRPNLFRVIAMSAETQPAATVRERLRAELSRAIGQHDGFRVLEWAGSDGAIDDNPRPTVAVLADRYAVSAAEDNGGLVGGAEIDQLWERSGGGFREWRNALILVAPDRELWARAEDAMREVLAYETVDDQARKHNLQLSPNEEKDLRARLKDKEEALRTSVTTAYRWVFAPDEDGLSQTSLPIPATKDERIVSRVIGRLSDMNYAQPKILERMGGVYFDTKILPRLWKDKDKPLVLDEVLRRFPQWTYLPILPNAQATLAGAIQDGVKSGSWSVAIGDYSTGSYQALLEKPEQIVSTSLFDGSAALVTGDLRDIIREELRKLARPTDLPAEPPEPPSPGPSDPPKPPEPIPAPARYSRVRITLDDLRVGKTNNLQPYLFKVLQEQDAGAELTMIIDVRSDVGMGQEALDARIVEGLEQLGIRVSWESN